MKQKKHRIAVALLSVGMLSSLFLGQLAEAVQAGESQAQVGTGQYCQQTEEAEDNGEETEELADTIGGTHTTAPTRVLTLGEGMEEENGWLENLFGSNKNITLNSVNIKGRGNRRNYTLDLMDCLVGLTYTELSSLLYYSFLDSNAAAEALRAQAIAAHSYVVYKNETGDTSGALTYTPVEQIPAAYRQRLTEILTPVKDYIVVYGSGSNPNDYQVCCTVFSCSGGYNTQTDVYGTCSSLDAWGFDAPYLQSVESKYEKKYHDLMRREIGKDYSYIEYNDSKYPSEPYRSADTTQKSRGGYVKYKTFTSNGRSYKYIGQFASARYCFDFGRDGLGKNAMTYYGFGHGVGMTQCGAVGYAAEEKWDFRRILNHYYSGTALMNTQDRTVTTVSVETGESTDGQNANIVWDITAVLQSWWNGIINVIKWCLGIR